jgi:hypothetical protein
VFSFTAESLSALQALDYETTLAIWHRRRIFSGNFYALPAI